MKTCLSILLICLVIALSGCATIVNDPNIPLAFSFSDGSTGQCDFKNKRGAWSSEIPTTNLLIRRSDDNLVYECTTNDGRTATGSIQSEIEAEKIGASVIFWDFGITDAITDKHRTYQGNIVIPVVDSLRSNSIGSKSVIDFYGEAEEEVNTDSYNKNLWAKALVEVEGDEAKRKAKYIELRANELYIQNGGTVSTASLNTQPIFGNEDQNLNISGVYASEITESGGRVNFTAKQRRMKITLEQNGNTITGTDSSKEIKINGTREGSTIEFYIIRGNQIKGVWEINADATKLEGKWSTDGGGGASGNWNLTRVEPAVNISESHSSTYFDFTGTYVSDRIDTNWALKNKAILRIRLKQNLNSIEGEFIQSLDGPIRGSIIGDKVEVTWEAGNCNSGEGTLSLDPDESTLSGFLLCRSQGMRKYDVVFRRM